MTDFEAWASRLLRSRGSIARALKDAHEGGAEDMQARCADIAVYWGATRKDWPSRVTAQLIAREILDLPLVPE